MLDLDHLRRQTLGDATLEADLLALFSHQARSIVGELSADSPDISSTRGRRADLLHLLTGSARAIGAWEVAEGAQALEAETRGAAASPHQHAAGLPRLTHAVLCACAAIDRRRAAAPERHAEEPGTTRR